MMFGINLVVFSGMMYGANYILYKNGNGFTKGQTILLTLILTFISSMPLLHTLE